MFRVRAKRAGLQGFSIIEAMIAIVVLGIVMAGGLGFFYYSNSLYSRGVHNQMATWIADSKLEELKKAGCTAATQDTGTTVGLIGDQTDTTNAAHLTGTRTVTWPATATQGVCGATTTKPACTSPTLVGVCVSWTEPGTAISSQVTLETYIGS
ncbi:MAG: prepilin-type N-terminal cleavage/methylation domain-containing protein [Candidatus Omnitrophota bacterium]